jgi:hypothetical protein
MRPRPLPGAWGKATAATSALLDRFDGERAEVPSLWHLKLANALAVGE